jgi:hypothetical protein
MSWNNVDHSYKMMYGEQFVNFPKPIERKFIIGAIAEEFPEYTRVRIASTVDKCFALNAVPVSRKKFMSFLQSVLR